MKEKQIDRPTQKLFSTTFGNSRQPVKSSEVRFMRQRLEGEKPLSFELQSAIESLSRLETNLALIEQAKGIELR